MQESGGAEPCRAFACVCKAAGRGLQPKGGPEMVLELVSDRKSLRKHMDTAPPVQLCHVRYQQLRDLWAPLKMLEFCLSLSFPFLPSLDFKGGWLSHDSK